MAFRKITSMRQVTEGPGHIFWEVFFGGQDHPALLPEHAAAVIQFQKRLMAAGFTSKQLQLIEEYGKVCHTDGCEEIRTDWAEADAGEDM